MKLSTIRRTLSGGAVLCAVMCAQCSALLNQKTDDDSQLLTVGLLAAVASQCTLGGITFIPGAGVTCSGGTASGTGTLTASTTAAHEQVAQVTAVISSGGKIDYVSSASGSALADGAYIRISTAGNSVSSPNRSTSRSFNTAFTVPSAGASETYCMQIHIHSGSTEGYAFKSACPVNAVGGATGDSCTSTFFNWQATTCTGAAGSTAGGSSAGSTWGYVLQSATITSVSIPSSARVN